VILLLLIGIGLAGLGSALLARALLGSRSRETPPVARIRRYGFTRSRGEQAKAALGTIIERAAGTVGTRFTGRLGKTDELRHELVAAGIYRVTPGTFLGYRILAVFGFALIWIWLASSTGMATVIAFLGTIVCGALGWWAPLQLVKDRAKRRLNGID
jgi:hypothetical protein